MDAESIRQAVFAALRPIAPEATPDEVQGDVPLRDQIDLDSMDFLHFVLALHDRLGIDIPESDYAQLITIDAIVEYLHQRLRASDPPISP
jgi:acyl carrier protein